MVYIYIYLCNMVNAHYLIIIYIYMYQCIITSATKCYKMNYSIPFTFRFHIVQSIPLTLQVTFIMRESKKVTTK